jgi:hypothetical protein
MLDLGQKGFAVVDTMRVPGGIHLTALKDGETTHHWYSLDECNLLTSRAASDVGGREAGTSARLARPTLARLLLVGALVCVAVALIARPRPVNPQLLVTQPTPVYSDAGDVLRTAEPGERYQILLVDGPWILGVPGGSTAESRLQPVWLIHDARVDVSREGQTEPLPS